MLTRRAFSLGALGAIAAPSISSAAGDIAAPLAEALAGIEAESGGRLGVAIRDTAGGQRFGHRGGERFPLCSTFKLLAAGAVLSRVDAGHEALGRRVVFTAADVVNYSPVTKDRVGGDGMSLAEICEAALARSDNTAGNLILTSLGGPSGVTGFARTLGDDLTRLDRMETALNEAAPGDPRDTTTPEAMAADIEALVLGTRLSAGSRDQLAAWLINCRTGGAKLRAGLPAGWRVGDKTGGGDFGTNNDVAVIWPPDRAPLIVCVYLTETTAGFDRGNATIAAVGRAIAGGRGG